MSDSKAVAKREEKLPAPADLLAQFAADQGQGMEHIGREDMAIPFLSIIQSLSPQRKRTDPKYITGAEEGMIFDSVTGELFDGSAGLLVVPVEYLKVFNEWTPRDSGGGFVKSHPTREIAEAECGEGNQIVDTANHFVLYQGKDGRWRQALLSMKSTALKVSRQWNTRMRDQVLAGPNGPFTPPSFAYSYLLRTVQEKNNKGEYFNFKVEQAGLVDPATYAAAKAFRQAIKTDAVKVKYEAAPETPVDEEDDRF